MKIYRGWMKSGLDHCLFETMKENLSIGDTLTDTWGREWEVEVIFQADTFRPCNATEAGSKSGKCRGQKKTRYGEVKRLRR